MSFHSGWRKWFPFVSEAISKIIPLDRIRHIGWKWNGGPDQAEPVEQRTEPAVSAWMRHQTTGYEDMVIPRVKGKRRKVRRMRARRSHDLLDGYRRGDVTCA